MKLCTIFYRLVIGGVLFCGTRPVTVAAENPPPADIIIYNAKVLTVNSNFVVAQALAVRGDQIVAVGRDKQVERFKGPETRMLDAHGHTVMPGLYDNQVDSYHAAISELNTPLSVFHSIAEALDYIRTQAAQKPAGTWITIERAYPTRLTENRLPTKAELDAAAPKHPVYWNCGPVAMVNSTAMAISKITGATKNPPGGEIVFDPGTRKPSGLLHNAASLLKLPPAITQTNVQQCRDALKQLYQLYNQQGITSIGEHGAEPEAIDLFRELATAGELTVRINCARFIEPINATSDNVAARLDALTNAPAGKLPSGPTGVGDDWVRIGPLKTRVDGDVLTGTAYLRTPWGIGPTYQISEPAYRGEFEQDPDTLVRLFYPRRASAVGRSALIAPATPRWINCSIAGKKCSSKPTSASAGF